MIFSAAVQWSTNSGDQMTVRMPVDYPPVIVTVIGFAVIILILLGLSFATRRPIMRTLFSLPVILLILGCAFMVYLHLSDTATAVLSRSKGTLTITEWKHRPNVYPLQGIQRVQVETSDGNSRRMVFLMANGQEVSFGRWHPREGMYQAADAINNFLVNVSPDGSDSLKDLPPEIRAQHEYARKLAEYMRKKSAGQDPGPEPQPPQP